MLAVAALHMPLHWSWIVNMTKRVFKIAMGQCKSMNARGKFNLAINGLLGLSGLITAISGLYFLLIPGASHNSSLADPRWLFSLVTWDLIHTWSGVVMIAVAVLHLDIHWKWVIKVSKKIFLGIAQRPASLPKKESAKSPKGTQYAKENHLLDSLSSFCWWSYLGCDQPHFINTNRKWKK